MLFFLKLGGSLITDKNHAHTVRFEVLHRLANEIEVARQKKPNLLLLLAHGSGSFGHVPAKKYGTRDGVFNVDQWAGFVEVWREAHRLNQIVLEVFSSHNLPVLSFPPSSTVMAKGKAIYKWEMGPIKSALEAGLMPILFGDVVFDLEIGATIFSTEELFIPLAKFLLPEKILIAGIESGVWQDFPTCKELFKVIDHKTDIQALNRIGPSRSIDVTGGMLEKVNLMRKLTSQSKNLEVNIFSGSVPGNVLDSLCGEDLGTSIRY